jgi:hypothetical protein
MSQEQPPIRSRRELRQARDERLKQQANQGAGPSGPAPAGPASQQPSKAGTAGQGRPQGKAPAEPAAQPTVPPLTTTSGPSAARDSAGQDSASGDSAAGAGRNRRAAAVPVDSVRPAPAGERSSQARARDRAALRTIKELAEKEGQLSAGGPPTRRQLRLQQLQAEAAPRTAANPVVPGGKNAPAPTPKPAREPVAGRGQEVAGKGQEQGPAGSAAPIPEGMTVEQALAARSLLVEQARNQIAMMEHIAADDPEAVDPEVLAQQIALAERAAVLNRRAMAKQKLAEQNSQPPKPRQDPASTNNLAMVTPLEFVQVPGVEGPVMKPPTTTHVPVVTNPGPRVQPSRTKGSRPAARRNGPPAAGRAGVLARAEAAAKAASSQPGSAAVPHMADSGENAFGENAVERPPVAANSAYGLEPLDAVTAGLGRAQRIRLLQLSVLALGIIALIAGIIMIISGLAP